MRSKRAIAASSRPAPNPLVRRSRSDSTSARSPTRTAADVPNASGSTPAGASFANRTWVASTPRRSASRSIRSSCTRADVCRSSSAAQTGTIGSSFTAARRSERPEAQRRPDPLPAGAEQAEQLVHQGDRRRVHPGQLRAAVAQEPLELAVDRPAHGLDRRRRWRRARCDPSSARRQYANAGPGSAATCPRAGGVLLSFGRAPARTMTRFQKLTIATTASTVLLITAGGLVRATGSGLGCPGWPTCFGRWIPPLETHAIIEYSHRLLATIAVILICLQAVVAWRQYRRVRQILVPSLAAVGTRVRAGGPRRGRGQGRARGDPRDPALRDRDDAARGPGEHHRELLLLREAADQGPVDRGLGSEVRAADAVDGRGRVRPADRRGVGPGRGRGARVPGLAPDGRPAGADARRRRDPDVRPPRARRGRPAARDLGRHPGPDDDEPLEGPRDPVVGDAAALRRADPRGRRQRVVEAVVGVGDGARRPVGVDLGRPRRDRHGEPPVRGSRPGRRGGRRALEREALEPARDDRRLLQAHEAADHRPAADHDRAGDGARGARAAVASA